MGLTRRADDEWYAGKDGKSTLRFECTQCGACCTGPEGAVHVNQREVRMLAKHIGITAEECIDRYTHMLPEGRSLIERETAPDSGCFDCVFLDRTSDPQRATCSVYDARPTQCRTFPWWPDNIKNPSSWRRAGTHCEGIGQGGYVPIEHIRVQRNAQEAAHPVRRGS